MFGPGDSQCLMSQDVLDTQRELIRRYPHKWQEIRAIIRCGVGSVADKSFLSDFEVRFLLGMEEFGPKLTPFEHAELMDGREFELFMRDVFVEKGYEVLMTPASGDFGVDLVMNQGGPQIAVQLKRHESYRPVGITAVQGAFTGAAYYNADEGWVIT